MCNLSDEIIKNFPGGGDYKFQGEGGQYIDEQTCWTGNSIEGIDPTSIGQEKRRGCIGE